MKKVIQPVVSYEGILLTTLKLMRLPKTPDDSEETLLTISIIQGSFYFPVECPLVSVLKSYLEKNFESSEYMRGRFPVVSL